MTVRLVQCTAAQLIEALPDRCVDLLLLDPPWLYTGAGRPGYGAAHDHYDGMPIPDVLADWEAAARACIEDAWAVAWVTFPLLMELLGAVALQPSFPWDYVSGGSWHKVSAKRGMGVHALGEAELWSLWRIGDPKTREQFGNSHTSKREAHSQKPPEVVRKHVRAWSDPGGLVLDPYAGSYATFAKVCLREGRKYIGSEADPARFARAEKILHHAREIYST